MERRNLYLVALAAEAVWVIGIIAAPYLASKGVNSISDSLYNAYRTVCHQKAERSLFVFGEQMAVCARCFGIYAGALIGTLLIPTYSKIEKMRIPDYRLVLIALAPLAVDGLTQLAGLRESSNELRLFTGFIFGIAFVSYFIPLALVRLVPRG